MTDVTQTTVTPPTVTQSDDDPSETSSPPGSLDDHSAKRSRIPLVLLALGGVLILLMGWARFAASPASVADRPLPKVAPVPSFTLTGRDGRTVTNADLLGKIWIADFFFTSCTGPCPTLSLRLRSLQSDLGHYGGDVKIVSFSVDPEYDRPALLRQYANRYGAKPDLWWFLTGDDEQEMHKMVKEGFLQPVSRTNKTMPVIHSTRFLLIDAEGYIRSWYDGDQAASKPIILRDIERLRKEMG